MASKSWRMSQDQNGCLVLGFLHSSPEADPLEAHQSPLNKPGSGHRNIEPPPASLDRSRGRTRGLWPSFLAVGPTPKHGHAQWSRRMPYAADRNRDVEPPLWCDGRCPPAMGNEQREVSLTSLPGALWHIYPAAQSRWRRSTPRSPDTRGHCVASHSSLA